MDATLSISSRFEGPPHRANGGYAAGAIAAHIGQPVAVRLHKPVPLETALSITARDASAWDVQAEQVRVASATSAVIETSVPSSPSYAEALAISKGYAAFSQLRSTRCFVCGVARTAGDGLRIFPGPIRDGRAQPCVAAPWCPERSVVDESGYVAPAVVWAALDCPGYFASFGDGAFALLGELSVSIEQPIEVEHEYVVMGFALGREGRKRRAGTGLFDRRGERVALGIATWIEVRRESAD